MAVNRLQDILDYRDLAITDPMKIMQLRNEAEMPMVNRAIGSRVGMPEENRMKSQQQLMMPQQEESSVNSLFKKRIPNKNGELTDILTEVTETFIDRMPVPEEEEEVETASLQNINRAVSGLDMRAAPALDYANYNPEKAAASGGLMGMALGDMPTQQAARGGGVNNFAGQVPGQGHGMQDNVYMPIIEKQAGQQVATLAVSPDEYVVDAHTMSALGNGSADEGARYMDNMVKNIRTKAYGTEKQPNEINGLAALRPMIERV